MNGNDRHPTSKIILSYAYSERMHPDKLTPCNLMSHIVILMQYRTDGYANGVRSWSGQHRILFTDDEY